MNDAERALAELAHAQRQVFTRAQAIDVGLSPSEIYRRRKSGLFVPYGPHTMHFAGSTLDFRGKLLAGLLDLGPGALVSGRSAAALHGLDGFDEGHLDFLVARSMRGRRAVGTVSSTACIEALDWVTIDGLDVTSGTRTVVELVGRVDTRELGNALDSATRKRLTAVQVVCDRLIALGRQGRPGVAGFDELRKLGAVQSWLERKFLKLVDGCGLPRPILQPEPVTKCRAERDIS